MTYEEWLVSVPQELTGDPLWRMEIYKLALFAGDLAWHDVSKLSQDKRTITIIPAERGYKLAEEHSTYNMDATRILDKPPMP